VLSWAPIQRISSKNTNFSDEAEKLLLLVYDELRQVAAHKMANEAPGHTLQPTELVHEAWMRLAGNDGAGFANRAHFIAAQTGPKRKNQRLQCRLRSASRAPASRAPPYLPSSTAE
jgi:hypothetical protein